MSKMTIIIQTIALMALLALSAIATCAYVVAACAGTCVVSKVVKFRRALASACGRRELVEIP